MERSKSTHLQTTSQANRDYAGILEPLLNLKYGKNELGHRPFMQLAEYLGKYNHILRKEVSNDKNERKTDWKELGEYAK